MKADKFAPGALLGAAYAEADSSMLREAFVETPDYQALRHTTDFNYVVGRRGTGKSAIFRRLVDDFVADESAVVLAEQPSDYEMLEFQTLLKEVSQEYRILRPISRLLWTVHFLLQATKAVTRHYKFTKSPDAAVLSDYLDKTTREVGLTATASCVSILRGLLRAGTSPAEIPRAIVEQYRVGEITTALKDTLLFTGLRIVALYDRLDESWVPDVAAVAILGGLAKTAADYREKQFPIYPVLFVRDNMFRALAQLDDDFTRHIEGHSLRLQWDVDSLLHLVTARLRVALSMKSDEPENAIKVWNRFAHRELHNRDGFQRCLRYTLYRPRDIVVLLNDAFINARREGRDSIVEGDIEKSAVRTSQHRLEDLCKEYDKVLPGIRLFTSSFRGLPARRPFSEVAAQLDSLVSTTDYADTAARELVLFQSGGEMFSALFSVGFVGTKENATGNFSFCHDGAMTALVTLSGELETLVHPCYWKALDTAVTGMAEDVLIQVNDDYKAPPKDDAVALRLKRLGRLPEELHAIPLGREGSGAFEGWVLRAARLLFAGALSNIELKPNPSGALNQRDVVARNTERTEFWRRIYSDYQTRQVIFECKNYSELTPEDFRQVLDYSTNDYGRFAIAVRRGKDSLLTDTEKSRMRSTFHEHKRIVLIVPSETLALCIRKLRTAKKYDYTEFTLAKYLDTIARTVLAMTHPPRYRQKRKR